MQRVGDGRIGQQGIYAGQDRVELRQHLLYSWNHIGSLTHSTYLLTACDGIARGHHTVGSITQHQQHFYIAHQVGSNLGTTALGHIQLGIYIDSSHYLACVLIVEHDILDHTYTVAVGKDRTGH